MTEKTPMQLVGYGDGLRSLWEVKMFADRAEATRQGRVKVESARLTMERTGFRCGYIAPNSKKSLPQAFPGEFLDLRPNGLAHRAPPGVEFLDVNYGVVVDSDLCVLDIDIPVWEPTLAFLADELKGIEKAPRVLTPHGVHVYFRCDRQPGRYAHSEAPMTLIADGHVVGPGSVIDGRMYIFDPSQTDAAPERTIVWSWTPKLDAPPGGRDKWPGFKDRDRGFTFS